MEQCKSTGARRSTKPMMERAGGASTRQLCHWVSTVEDIMRDLERFETALALIPCPSKHQAQGDLFAQQSPQQALSSVVARLKSLSGAIENTIIKGHNHE